MPVVNTVVEESAAFVGTVRCSTLADVIQLHAHTRFAGRLTVEHAGQEGRVYFRNGEIIHAEMGDEIGERAFSRIMAWPSGRFNSDLDVSTTHASIHKNWQHLLLDVFRLQDECRAGLTHSEHVVDRSAAGSDVIDVAQRIRGIASVTYAIAQLGYDAPLGDDSREAKLLGRDARYLAFLGKQLGALFGTGAVVSAAVSGSESQLLLFASKNASVGVLTEAGTMPPSFPQIGGAIAALGWNVRRAMPPRNGAQVRAWRGSMECDPEGHVLASTLHVTRERVLAREAGLIVADAIAALDAATGTVATIGLEYDDGRLDVKRLVAGFTLQWEIISSSSVDARTAASYVGSNELSEAPPILTRVNVQLRDAAPIACPP